MGPKKVKIVYTMTIKESQSLVLVSDIVIILFFCELSILQYSFSDLLS